ncbi:MAG: aldehyde ferredoxin oxidoreductase family protein [Candidatus Hodarchaeales archaeon]|jgi:aldehyde:ferredoxin oxidoreductase
MSYLNRKRLHIDLTEEKVIIQDIPNDILMKYIGGIGLGSYYLWKEVPPQTDPLGKNNILFFCIGPAQGSNITMTGRYCLVTKSPLTGLLMDSHSGGDIGPDLAFLGYCMLSIGGKAQKPVYIYITDENTVEILNWTYGRAKTTHETEKIINDIHNTTNTHVISTGPAGENLVPYACLVNDQHRNLGRGGAGAIFGAKNLKAVAFNPARRSVLRSDKINTMAKEINKRVKAAREHPLHSKGTPWLVNLANSWSMLPTRNFQTGYFENHEKINDHALEQFQTKKKGCFRCSLNCGFIIKDQTFKWTSDSEISMPEYETLGMLGSNLGIDDLESIIQMNHQCNTLGLDTISVGSSLGFLAELNEKNMIPLEIAKYKNQIPLFGDVNAFRDLIIKIAQRTGLGEFVSLGPAEMAVRAPVEASNFAIHVKKLPMAAWDPRGKFLSGLGYATAAIGASHLRGWSTKLSSPLKFDSNKEEHHEAFEEVIYQMNLKILKDSLIVCHFTHSIAPPLQITDFKQLLHAVMDREYTNKELREISQRIWITQRLFNIREMSDDPVKYDVLPERFMNETLKHKPAIGCKAFTSKEEFGQILNLFYQFRGLDETGRPFPKTLSNLEIS